MLNDKMTVSMSMGMEFENTTKVYHKAILNETGGTTKGQGYLSDSE